MGHAFIVLMVLSAGQVPDSKPFPPPIPGWTPQSRTWTQTGTWTPETGWVWQASSTDGPDTSPVVPPRADESSATSKTQAVTPAQSPPNLFSRIGDKVTSLFKPGNSKTIGEQSAGHNPSSAVVSTQEPPLLDAAELRRLSASAQPGLFDVAALQPVKIQDSAVKALVLDGQSHKAGHSADYSVLVGRLEIVNGAYFVHYAAPDSADRFGGRMILTGNLDLSKFRSADLVTLRGSVTPGRTISLYRTHYIELLERTAN